MSAKLLRGLYLGLQEEHQEVTQSLRSQIQDGRERAQRLESRVKELESQAAEADACRGNSLERGAKNSEQRGPAHLALGKDSPKEYALILPDFKACKKCFWEEELVTGDNDGICEHLAETPRRPLRSAALCESPPRLPGALSPSCVASSSASSGDGASPKEQVFRMDGRMKQEASSMREELDRTRREKDALQLDLERLQEEQRTRAFASEAAQRELSDEIQQLKEQLGKASLREDLSRREIEQLSKDLEASNCAFAEAKAAGEEQLRLEVVKCQQQHRQIKELESALRVEAELAKDFSQAKWEAEGLARHLRDADEQLISIRKELLALCSCTLSFKLMRQPVLGTDLRTYDKEAIEQALDHKPASPFTRAPMMKTQLRPNRFAADLLELVVKHFPNLEEEDPVQVVPPPAVGPELVRAIRAGRADEAIELLGREVNLAYLNGMFPCNDVSMTLLQMSISCHLPQVAIAIVKRPDFRRAERFSGQGLLAIHMAASYNYTDVCDAILEDVGKHYWKVRTKRTVELIDPLGRLALLPEWSTALDCARRFGHSPRWAES